MELDGDLVEASQELKVHGEVIKDTKVFGLKRNVDGMLGTWKKLTLCWKGMEMRNFGEIEVNCQVFILILNREIIITTLILWTFTKGYSLSTDFNVGVASSSHHLYL